MSKSGSRFMSRRGTTQTFSREQRLSFCGPIKIVGEILSMTRRIFSCFTSLVLVCFMLNSFAFAQTAERVPIELVTLTRSGVFPSTISRPPGAFVLFVRNQLPQHRNAYTLMQGPSDAGDAARIVATLAADEFHDYAYQKLILTAGTYVLQFKNNPQYTVTVTITP